MIEQAPTAEGGRRYLGLLVLAVVVAAVAIVLVMLPNDNQAPFTPPQANPKLVGLQVLTPADARGLNIESALDRLGGSPANNIEMPRGHPTWQYVVGRVDVVGRHAPNAEYDVIVVDNRLHRVAPSTYSYPEPGQEDRDHQGWGSALGSLAKQYDWRPSGLDQAALFPADQTTSFIFWARLPAAASAVANEHTDVSVVLALTSGSDHVFWSEKIN